MKKKILLTVILVAALVMALIPFGVLNATPSVTTTFNGTLTWDNTFVRPISPGDYTTVYAGTD